MFPPLLIMKGCHFNPSFEILVLSLNYSLLPFLVCANIVILIETVMTMMFSLFKRHRR
jgi:hypothetical protein